MFRNFWVNGVRDCARAEAKDGLVEFFSCEGGSLAQCKPRSTECLDDRVIGYFINPDIPKKPNWIERVNFDFLTNAEAPPSGKEGLSHPPWSNVEQAN